MFASGFKARPRRCGPGARLLRGRSGGGHRGATTVRMHACLVSCMRGSMQRAAEDKFALSLLRRQFAELQQQDDAPFSVSLPEDDFFAWEVWFTGPAGTLYENGSFHATLKFPENFPNAPPVMKMKEDMHHPNIFPDGTVCISILHPPGTDDMNEQETADERWRPIISVETIMRSVLLMIAHPNLDSPANVDAAVEMKTRPEQYKRKIWKLVESTLA